AQRFELVADDVDSTHRITLSNLFRIRQFVRRPKRCDQTFFDPTVNLIRKGSQSPVLGVTANVHQLCYRLAYAVQQPLDRVRLDAMLREFAYDVLFVFRKDGRNVDHVVSISERLRTPIETKII